jgi:hypothetical protein
MMPTIFFFGLRDPLRFPMDVQIVIFPLFVTGALSPADNILYLEVGAWCLEPIWFHSGLKQLARKEGKSSQCCRRVNPSW